MNHLDLTDIHRALHPTKTKNTFFSSVHRAFFRIRNKKKLSLNLEKLKSYNYFL